MPPMINPQPSFSNKENKTMNNFFNVASLIAKNSKKMPFDSPSFEDPNNRL
jgi:hypothetical protein